MDEIEAERPEAAVPKSRARRKPARKKADGRWSAARERKFLEMLGQTSNVAASARAAGIAESTVYRRRTKHEEFRAAWAAALREGVSKLETMLLDRALNGITKPVWHGGKQVGTMTEYSDRLALALLNAHRATVMGEPAAETRSAEALRDDLLARFAEMNRALGGEG